MFGEKNINKYLNKYKELFGFNIELEWCSMRRKNKHILIANPGSKLKDDSLYQIILGLTKDCEKQNYFKRLEFIGLFPDPQDNTDVKYLNEYWVLKIIQDTRNRNIFQDKHGDLVVGFL